MMKKKKTRWTLWSAVFLFLPSMVLPGQSSAARRFEVTFPASLRSEAVTGRLIVVVTRKDSPEPRLAISPYGPPIFGVDVERLLPGSVAAVDETCPGYPLSSPEDLPAGDYFVQAVLNVYTECRRTDGRTIWVHIDRSRGTPFNVSPGNMYSDPQKIHLEPGVDSVAKLTLSHVIPQDELPPDTEWLRHVWIQSERLSRFWGQPVYFGATVLLPKGYKAHPETHYPTVYAFEHGVPFGFDPDPKSHEPDEPGARSAGLETGYEFFQSWASDGFPRFIAVTFHQPTPYFPSSYSVNSANCGPSGDALLGELIPYLEREFRMIPKPYARLVEGASTGGWEALSLELRHPDTFGGAWVYNPDPIDFRRYQLVNIYEDENAFAFPAFEWRTVERPFRRTTEGQVLDTVRSMSLFEEVLGTHGRSGYQLMGWEAVYGPAGPDGYPVPLWDKKTGKIDRAVADYMREKGYDLREYAARNWATLGPKVEGKLNFFAGEMDNFYLNQAVYLFEDFLRSASVPQFPIRFEYGRLKKGHNWHPFTWAQMLREMADHIVKAAPPGEKTSAWRY
jgi:Putative esterase